MGEGRNKSNQPSRFVKTCGAPSETLAIKTESGLLFEGQRMNTTDRRAPKRDGGLRLSKNLRRTRKGRTLSNFRQQRVRWNGTTFAAENPVSRAKTGEGGMRPGACIPVHQLIKTFFDKQRPPRSEKRRRSVFMRFRFQTCAVRRAGAVPCRLGAARRSGRRECRHTGCRGLRRSLRAQRRRAS